MYCWLIDNVKLLYIESRKQVGLKELALSKEEKIQSVNEFGLSESDTGSSAVQVALLTKRINILNEHLKISKKDKHSRRGLLLMVGKRRRFLDYIAKHNFAQYQELIKRLGLRK